MMYIVLRGCTLARIQLASVEVTRTTRHVNALWPAQAQLHPSDAIDPPAANARLYGGPVLVPLTTFGVANQHSWSITIFQSARTNSQALITPFYNLYTP